MFIVSPDAMAQGEMSQSNNERKERPQVMRPPKGQRPPGRPGGGMSMPGGPGSRSKDIKYAGATELTVQTSEVGKTYQSSKSDESALMISTKEAVTIAQPNVNKTGSSDGGDNCSFYGVNAALLVKGGSTTTIKGGTIKFTRYLLHSRCDGV